MEQGTHKGHRQRMYAKLKDGASLYDHEILEIFLFNALPRCNTNVIAHDLLQTFGSLGGVFEADVQKLTTVKGVGENVALYIKCAGECLKRVNPANSGFAVLKSYKDVTDFVKMRLQGKSAEVLEFYFLDKSGKVTGVYPFGCDDAHMAEVAADKITSLIAAAHPYSVVIAHNHPRGEAEPSGNDDIFTKQAQVICSLNGAVLQDHCIYAAGEVYSYFKSGKLDKIRNSYNFKNIINDYIGKGI